MADGHQIHLRPCCLLFKELGILGTLGPMLVKGGGVLIHKVGVFEPTRASKVLADLYG